MLYNQSHEKRNNCYSLKWRIMLMWQFCFLASCYLYRFRSGIRWSNLIFYIFFSVGLPFAILNVQHNPFKRGFFCNDDTIRYPYKEDTISYQLLMGIMIPFTLFVVSISFFFFQFLKRKTLITNPSMSYRFLKILLRT